MKSIYILSHFSSSYMKFSWLSDVSFVHCFFLLDQDLLEDVIADSCFQTSQHIVSLERSPTQILLKTLQRLLTDCLGVICLHESSTWASSIRLWSNTGERDVNAVKGYLYSDLSTVQRVIDNKRCVLERGRRSLQLRDCKWHHKTPAMTQTWTNRHCACVQVRQCESDDFVEGWLTRRELVDRSLVCKCDYKSCHTAPCNSTHIITHKVTPTNTHTKKRKA